MVDDGQKSQASICFESDEAQKLPKAERTQLPTDLTLTADFFLSLSDSVHTSTNYLQLQDELLTYAAISISSV